MQAEFPKIGILGAGQLGRMLALAGYPLGLRFRFLDTSPDAPAGQLGELMVGDYADSLTLRQFALGVDIVTYEFENVPSSAAMFLAQQVAVYPPTRALEVSQDRFTEKTFLQQQGIPTPVFMPVDGRAQLQDAIRRIGFPSILKTRRMGYDGRGQIILYSPDDVDVGFDAMNGVPSILEQYIAFDREVSLLAVRSRVGQVAYYPLVENQHQGGILRFSSPLLAADGMPLYADLQRQAQEHATHIMEALDYVGVLAIEYFVVGSHLVANEIAPRVHNSGHWTIEGAETSQFENHLRATLGLPLGSTAPLGYSAMLNLIGHVPNTSAILSVPGAHLHLYSKQARPGRKLGHITISSSSEHACAAAIAQLRSLLDSSQE